MRFSSLIIHSLKIVLRIFTYAVGLLLLLSLIGNDLRFKPSNLSELLYSFHDVPLNVIFERYFKHFFDIMFNCATIAGFTMIPFAFRLGFKGFHEAFQHELDTGHYRIINTETNKEVYRGYDGLENAFMVILSRIIVIGMIFSLSFILIPIMLLWDIVKLVIMIVNLIKGNE